MAINVNFRWAFQQLSRCQAVKVVEWDNAVVVPILNNTEDTLSMDLNHHEWGNAIFLEGENDNIYVEDFIIGVEIPLKSTIGDTFTLIPLTYYKP